jgi:hypothetical protein
MTSSFASGNHTGASAEWAWPFQIALCSSRGLVCLCWTLPAVRCRYRIVHMPGRRYELDGCQSALNC